MNDIDGCSTAVKAAVRAVIGKPCWSATRNAGQVFPGLRGTISLDFGEPRLHVGAVKEWSIGVPGAPPETLGRLINIHGEWRILVERCQWRLLLHDVVLATADSSAEEAGLAFEVLSGQAIADVVVDASTGATTFHFDLGCQLVAAASNVDQAKTLWTLTTYGTSYFAVRSDGQCVTRNFSGSAEDPERGHP